MNRHLGPQNCRGCPVSKHFGPYFDQTFVHIFALYVGGGGHSRVSDSSPFSVVFESILSRLRVATCNRLKIDPEERLEMDSLRGGGSVVGNIPSRNNRNKNSRRLWLFPGSLRGFQRKP